MDQQIHLLQQFTMRHCLNSTRHRCTSNRLGHQHTSNPPSTSPSATLYAGVTPVIQYGATLSVQHTGPEQRGKRGRQRTGTREWPWTRQSWGRLQPATATAVLHPPAEYAGSACLGGSIPGPTSTMRSMTTVDRILKYQETLTMIYFVGVVGMM